jgi:hypothetical protein
MFVMATTGCGICHKDTDKCSNNKTKIKQTQNYETTNKYFSKYCEYNIKKFGINYTHIIKGPNNKQ